MLPCKDTKVLIFIDIETTGLEATDKICSIGLLTCKDTIVYELLNEGKKIPPKASSIHHITNEMLQDKGTFAHSQAHKFLQEHNTPDATLIAHNIKFDLQKLSAAGFEWKGKVIDTLRVTKHLIPECEFFSLQILRYELQLYKKEKEILVAHNALGDVHVVKLLYEYLHELASHEQMCELSFQKVLLQKLEFGKYAGRYIEEIAMCDKAYLEWMLLGISELDEDVRYSIMLHLKGDG